MENNQDEKMIFKSFDSVFLNSENVFIEINDVIKGPMFLFLDIIRNNKDFSRLFDFSPVKDLDTRGLYDWYLNRQEQVILKNFNPIPLTVGKIFEDPETLEFDKKGFDRFCIEAPYMFLEEISKHGNGESPILDIDTDFAFAKAIDFILNIDFVHNIYFYTDAKSVEYENDITNKFNASNKSKVKFVYGDIESIIKENHITANSTFVFSDVTKINALANAGILRFSSIILMEHFGYNYTGDKNIKLKVDIDKLLSTYGIFKLDCVNNLKV